MGRPSIYRKPMTPAERQRRRRKLLRVRKKQARVEWYTLPEFIDMARAVLGSIDLDPATCAQAQAYIRAACDYSGLGRSSLYKEAARHPGLFRKWNGESGKTHVDFDKLDAILSALPPAEIKLPHLAKARRG